jgi:hypothetical protein
MHIYQEMDFMNKYIFQFRVFYLIFAGKQASLSFKQVHQIFQNNTLPNFCRLSGSI